MAMKKKNMRVKQNGLPHIEMAHYPANDIDRAQKVLKDIFQSHAANHQHNEFTKRTTIEMGYAYKDLLEGNNNNYTEIPQEIRDIYNKTRQALVANNPDLQNHLPTKFNNCIISHYGPGEQLVPHIDSDIDKARRITRKTRGQLQESFYFTESVIGLVTAADSKGSLYLQQQDPKYSTSHIQSHAHPLPEQDGTIYVLSGKARHFPWQHGVSTIENERYSITFRTAKFLQPS